MLEQEHTDRLRAELLRRSPSALEQADLPLREGTASWSSAVREESVRRREATDKLSTRLKEEIDKLASNGRLDMNLERARAKEELRVSQDELLAEAKRIEGMLLNHQQEILKMKNDLFKVRSTLA